MMATLRVIGPPGLGPRGAQIKPQLQKNPLLTAVSKDVEAMFKKHDRDGSGYIEIGELQSALRELGINVTPAMVENFLRNYDSNANRRLDLLEFNKLVKDARGIDEPEPKPLPMGFDQPLPPRVEPGRGSMGLAADQPLLGASSPRRDLAAPSGRYGEVDQPLPSRGAAPLRMDPGADQPLPRGTALPAMGLAGGDGTGRYSDRIQEVGSSGDVPLPRR